MVNYFAKYCDTLSEKLAPLRAFLKSKTEWQWDNNTAKVFDSIKAAVSSLPVLRLCNSALPMVLSVDTSPIGVSAVLMQLGQPLEFASRTLTDTQQRYAQIEKELLAVQFGIQHFHQYVYGQTLLIELDHKPLFSILQKHIVSCSPSIQRMRLLMQIYYFEIVYKPGKDLYVVDALSRAPEKRQYVEDSAQLSDECGITDGGPYVSRQVCIRNGSRFNFGHGQAIGSKRLARTHEKLKSCGQTLLESSLRFEWVRRSSA